MPLWVKKRFRESQREVKSAGSRAQSQSSACRMLSRSSAHGKYGERWVRLIFKHYTQPSAERTGTHTHTHRSQGESWWSLELNLRYHLISKSFTFSFVCRLLSLNSQKWQRFSLVLACRLLHNWPGYPERSMLAQSRLLAMRKLSFRESGLLNQSCGTAGVEGREGLRV